MNEWEVENKIERHESCLTSENERKKKYLESYEN